MIGSGCAVGLWMESKGGSSRAQIRVVLYEGTCGSERKDLWAITKLHGKYRAALRPCSSVHIRVIGLDFEIVCERGYGESGVFQIDVVSVLGRRKCRTDGIVTARAVNCSERSSSTCRPVIR
jgi:hypothetical protein